MLNCCKYSELPNKRACSLNFFEKKIHTTSSFSCNKQWIPLCSFVDLQKYITAWNFFPTYLFIVYHGAQSTYLCQNAKCKIIPNVFALHTKLKVFFFFRKWDSFFKSPNLPKKLFQKLSWAWNLNKLLTDMGGNFKFQAQDSFLE